jgi:hypothetical protein
MGVNPYLALAIGIGFALSASWAISVYLEPRLQQAMKAFLLNIHSKAMARPA